jgi:hypothetical protein
MFFLRVGGIGCFTTVSGGYWFFGVGVMVFGSVLVFYVVGFYRFLEWLLGLCGGLRRWVVWIYHRQLLEVLAVV